MTDLAVAYAAGLIDGEGCVGVYHNSHNGNYQLRVTVEMTVKAPLVMLSKLFGGKFYKRDRGGNRKPTWSWMVFNGEAQYLLRAVQPFLKVKHRQAKIALEGTWGAISETERFAGIDPKKQNKRTSIHARIKKLNARGRQH